MVKKYMAKSYRFFVLLFFFTVLYLLSANTPAVRESGSMINFMIDSLGGMKYDVSIELVILIMKITPTVLVMFLVADIMKDDFSVLCIYAFPRYAKPEVWLLKKYLEVFLNLVVFYAFVFLIGFAISESFGFAFALTSKNIEILFTLYILNVLAAFTISVIENILSLFVGVAKSFIFIIIYIVITAVIIILFYNKNQILSALEMTFLSSNQFYLLHEGAGKLPIKGLSFAFSYIYLPIACVISYFVGLLLLKKNDLTMLAGEE